MSGQARLADAVQAARTEGYSERGDGRWRTPDGEILPEGVDPKPVQLEAIEFLFETGIEKADQGDEDFVLWTVKGVTKTLVREGDPLSENVERVFKSWGQTVTEDVAEEAARQLERAGYLDDEEE